MAHKITRNITKVSDIKKLGMNVTNECDLVSDGTNVYVRVGKEYRQIDNDSKPDLTTYYNKTQVDNLLKKITDRVTELDKTAEFEALASRVEVLEKKG